MNNQPYSPPEPARNANQKAIIIIVSVVLVICCLCTAITGGLAAALFWSRPVQHTSNLAPTPFEEAIQVQEETPLAPEVEDTPTPEDTPVPEDTAIPTLAPTATLAATSTEPSSGTDTGKGHSLGLGVSRAEMIDFYTSGGAFEFSQPTEVQGLEIVMGKHTWLCVDTNCAAVTLGGPEEELQVIAVVVPTKPGDSAQTTLGLLLLMTTAARFADARDVDVIPGQILKDLLQAQSSSQNFEKTIESNDYIFTETYDATTHNAGLGISRKK